MIQLPGVQRLPLAEIEETLRGANVFPCTMDVDGNCGWENVNWELLKHPQCLLMVCVDIHVNDFMDWAHWCVVGDWGDMDPRAITTSIHLLVDLNSGQVLAYCCMYNRRSRFTKLGVLDSNHEFTRMVIDRARQCMQKFLSNKS